jgi:hypothetical protein
MSLVLWTTRADYTKRLHHSKACSSRKDNMKHTEPPFEIVELSEPLDPTWQTRYIIKAPDAPGGVALTIGGIGEEERANASLFRAAPDMLEALEAIIQAFNGTRDRLGRLNPGAGVGEPLRLLAVKYKVGGATDSMHQAQLVAQAVVASARQL